VVLLIAGALLSSCFVGIFIDNRGLTAIVYESSGKRQCEPAAITPQQSASRLTQAGVGVITSSCAVLTSNAYPAVCGAPSGELVLQEIRDSDVGTVQRLGFTLVSTLQVSSGDPGYARIDCAAAP
jgi:hypothetical protein